MFPLSSKPFTILLFLTVTLASVNKVTATGTDLLDFFLGWFDDSSEEDYSDESIDNGSYNVTCQNCTVYFNVNNQTSSNTSGMAATMPTTMTTNSSTLTTPMPVGDNMASDMAP